MDQLGVRVPPPVDRHISSFRSYSFRQGRTLNRVEILTLDPNKFAEKKQRRLNIGGKFSVKPRVSLHKQSSFFKSLRLSYGTLMSNKPAYYPLDTKAFLYYSIAPGKPRIAGELRLRVASSDDLTSFESGSDLLLNGRTWTHPLSALINSSAMYYLLYEKLREDNLIPDDLDRALSTLAAEKFPTRQISTLYTLHDTFIVDFSISHSTFSFITEQGMGSLPLQRIFSDGRELCKFTPYSGAYTNCRLGPSVLRY